MISEDTLPSEQPTRRIRRFFDWVYRLFHPVPAIGASTTFQVLERHWDDAVVACKYNGHRSTHCVLAQAIAERFRIPYVGVGGDGNVTAYYKISDPIMYLEVDGTGVDIIERFDSAGKYNMNPQSENKPMFPITVSIKRLSDDD